MKKSLSLLLAIAMIFGAFASVALAADPTTTQEKFDALKAKGVFVGVNANGDAGLDQKMTRAQFARVLGLLAGLNVDAAPAKQDFTDVGPNFWAYQEVGAAFKAGLMVGIGNKKFNPNGNIIVQDLAITIVNVLGLKKVDGATVEGASAYAAPYIKALQDAGIALPPTYKVAATRALLVEAAYAVYVKITTPAVLSVSKVAQSGAKVVSVEFNRAATADEQKAAKFEVKNGLVSYPVTAKFAADGKSVALTAAYLPAGDYTLKVNELAAVPVKVEDERVAKVEIGATAMQKAANQVIDAKALNQFGEVVEYALNDSNISVFSSVYGVKTVTSGKVDLSNEAVDTTIVVTVTHPSTGLSATKTFKVTAASSATSITLGPVVPLTGDTRVAVSKIGYVLPYTLKDQLGQALKLTELTAPAATTTTSSATINGITFVSSNPAIVDATKFRVDANGVLTFNTGTTSGTVVITAYSASTGATATTTVNVTAAPILKTFQVSNPGQLIVSGEAVVFPYVATDTYSTPIAKKDVPSAVAVPAVNFSISTSNPSVNPISTSWKANGDLQLSFGGSGATTLYFWANGTIASQVNVDVKPVASSVRITGLNDIKSTMALNAAQTGVDASLNVLDNYGRTSNTFGGTLKVVEAAPSGGAVTYSAATGGTITANAAGTEVITFGIDKNSDGVADAGTTFAVTFTVVDLDKVTNFSMDAIGTIKVVDPANASAVTAFSKPVTVVGKTADGTAVAIRQTDFVSQITSSDLNIADVTASRSVYGIAKGTATVAAWKGGQKLAEAAVTVSDAASVLTSLSFDIPSVNVTAATAELAGHLVAKDQYGVPINGNGQYYSSNTAVATVDLNTGHVAKGTVAGEAIITYVARNGMSASVTANVDH